MIEWRKYLHRRARVRPSTAARGSTCRLCAGGLAAGDQVVRPRSGIVAHLACVEALPADGRPCVPRARRGERDADLRRRVLAALAGVEAITPYRLALTVGCGHDALDDALRLLARTGEVERADGRVRLTADGRLLAGVAA